MRVLLLPGYGLDSRIYAGLDLPAEVFRAADFIPVRPGESFGAYAGRLADSLGHGPGDMVGGLSLGGMLAAEIAARRGARKLLLLASGTGPGSVRPPIRALARLAPMVPGAALRTGFRGLPTVLKALGLLSESGAGTLVRSMVAAFPPQLFREFPRMLLAWPGADPAVPRAHLHSTRDWVIRPRPAPDIQWVEGPFHLLPFSHPALVRDFLLRESAS